MSGGCQCGAVRYVATEFLDNARICHCRMCQKAAGSFFAALVDAPKEALTWTRGRPARFRSSDHVDRGFCAACGTPLFYDNVDGGYFGLTIGSLDHPERFKPVSQDSIEGKMPWFDELPLVPNSGVTGAGGEEAWAAAIKASNRQHPDHDTETWPPLGPLEQRP